MSTPVPTIIYTPCESSQIAAHGYDAAAQVLGIEFKNGGAKYHYHPVTQAFYDDMLIAKSIGTFFGANIRNKIPFARQPDEATGVVFGLALEQSSKYTASSKTGRITVRATGKPIPDDEPIFILRASDVHAVDVLAHYTGLCEHDDHRVQADRVTEAFERFAETHGTRMKEPDTTVAA